VLRYKQPDAPNREWKVPLNPRLGGREFPLGLGLITVVLFVVAFLNLFTKETATISGVIFTVLFYLMFVVSERAMHKRHAHAHGEHTDQFQLMRESDFGLDQLHARAGGVLVPVRDYNTLTHLDRALHDTDTAHRDVVVLTIRLLTGPDAGVSDIEREELFTDYEQKLFTRVVAVAERQGRAVKLLVVPSTNAFDAIAQSAARLHVREIAMGESAKMTAADQALRLGEAWDRTPRDASLATSLSVYAADGQVRRFPLGAHAPDLSSDDVARIHELWVQAVRIVGPEVHHRDIVSAALDSLRDELASGTRETALARLRGRQERVL